MFKRKTPLREMLEPFDVEAVKAFSLSLAFIADTVQQISKPTKANLDAIADLRATCVALDKFRTTLEKYQ